MNIAFTPSADVEMLLNTLLDRYERRTPGPPDEGGARRAIHCYLTDLDLPGYFSQVDPEPRLVANHQLQDCEEAGLLRLAWLTGEKGHLLEAVFLLPQGAETIFRFLGRSPIAGERKRLEDMLLAERFRFAATPCDWRQRAIQSILAGLRGGHSPSPFILGDDPFNQDLLTALTGLEGLGEETPYRVFSVQVFNDSKRFEALKSGVVRLARLGRPEWRRLPSEEVLRELNLVANPGTIFLSGPWELSDDRGQVLLLEGFNPSVGLSAVQAARLRSVRVHSPAVVCIENLTTYYEANRRTRSALESPSASPPAYLCLSGNPSPACRHLLRCLLEGLPEHIPLLVWADLDYGGMNILSQIRRLVSPRFEPYRMDIETLEDHITRARPISPGDGRNLKQLTRRPELADLRPVIEHMLRRGLKLEQEAIAPGMLNL